GVHERGIRMARRRLFDVPGDERRPAHRARAVRLVVESQLPRTPGQSDGPHAADESRDGRRGGGRRRSDGRTEDAVTSITRGEGRGPPPAGPHIDTHRITRARCVRTVSFAGLAADVFAAGRGAATADGTVHPFDDAPYETASILIVNENFGCGSSREHAPQAIYRRGIRAI